MPIVGALIFPVGFVMIVLLNLELVTGSFAVLPMAQMDGAIRFAATMRNWAWAFVGNLAGNLIYAAMSKNSRGLLGSGPHLFKAATRGMRRFVTRSYWVCRNCD